MATGPEHYREAERLIMDIALDSNTYDVELRDRAVARAQVHATLALAAATALASTGVGEADMGEWTALICEPNDPYAGMTNADVMSASELEEYDRAAKAYDYARDEAEDTDDYQPGDEHDYEPCDEGEYIADQADDEDGAF